ncbi:YeeE/YedE family protein [Oscillatoria sp. FACHB-1407]|uniref:YeeE/YedE family protein n=1 Tax=Oscillatoria sp. FACHB-1407 TaxID=2692847 RepID=UPI001688C98F|nr:YeeE/YedE family protein [Oscillatoria sp. FACHB-1407]MBD2464875.1 YeeE/YedE family protein [Oscillatoria sp. FACHB-1407]
MSHTSDLPLAKYQQASPRPQTVIIAVLLGLIVFGAIIVSPFGGWKQSVLFLIGGLFGLSLYHASFGFASSYRKLFVYRDSQGVLAQILMLAIATLIFAPFLLAGSAFGQDLRGAVAPVGVQGIIGAFLFGIGMQLGSGCACGTLYTIGGGSSMMLLTLLTFGLGSFWASLTGSLWAGLPKTEPISLVQSWGWLGVAGQLLVLAAIAALLWQWGRKSLPPTESKSSTQPFSLRNLLYGPWSLVFGAIALAILNWLTLLLAGRPWGVTWGFTLWTAKIAQTLGWNPATSEFWSQGMGAEALSQSVFADITSVMNFGIVLGAALAAALAGRLTVKRPPSKWAIAAALVGGLMMGYGARLAFGCNVGAYFSGIASTSLHGWLWITFALLGTGIGIRLRSLFQLSN